MTKSQAAATAEAVDLAMKPADAVSFNDSIILYARFEEAFGASCAHYIFLSLDLLRDQNCSLRTLLVDSENPNRDNEIRRHLLQTLTSAVEQIMSMNPLSRSVVISVHGIKTRGVWQKDLAPVLAEAGFIPELMDFGNFFALELLIPFLRRRKIEWFFKEYSKIAHRHRGRKISVVAHSFGTYLVVRSLEKYSDHIRYDRIIFCGSIVRRDFPWDQFASKGCITKLLNEYGHMDFWAWIVAYVVKDAGQAGREGFAGGDGCMTQREHPEHRHSDYFHPLNYSQTWVPFLQGNAVEALVGQSIAHKNPLFKYTVIIFAALLVTGAFAVAWWFNLFNRIFRR